MKNFVAIFSACIFIISALPSLAHSADSAIVVSNIVIVGNKTTKDFIVKRELLFAEGDTIQKNQIENVIQRSRENLLNTSLFNFVTINLVDIDNCQKQVFILLEERWYWWPYINIEQADRNLSAFFDNGEWKRVNYGLMLVKNNFRGRAETIKVKLRFGYKQQFQIYYDIPYLTTNKKHGFGIQYSLYRQKEINYATDSCKPIYYSNDDRYVIKNQDLYFFYTYRPKYDVRHILTASYARAHVLDTIIALNKNYFATENARTQYLTLSYTFDWDMRDYKYYPLRGHNIRAEFCKIGLNLLDNELDGEWYTRLSAYKYFDFGHRFYGGLGGLAKYSPNKLQPYYTERALGYDDYLRGFEYYVIDGQRFATGRAFAKFAILPMRVTKFDNWSWEQFNKVHYSLYANIFVDVGYVNDVNNSRNNYLADKLLTSVGAGIDLITYYDLVFRFEATYSEKGQSGLYVHLKKAF